MLDIHFLLNHIDIVQHKYQQRGFEFDKDTLIDLAERKKTLQMSLEEQNQLANQNARAIGQNRHDQTLVETLKIKGEVLKEAIKLLQIEFERADTLLKNYLLTLPNLQQDIVPYGEGDLDNLEVRRWGEPRHETWHREHDDIGVNLGLRADLGAKLSGSRFTVLTKHMATLHRALVQFMLNEHLDHGYEEVYVPYLVKAPAMLGTGQLPKFAEDMFAVDDFYLIPTAEVPVTNLVAGEILENAVLPLNFVAHTPCFRREVGSAGRDTKGMIRQHQFDKVELVKIVRPEESNQELETLVGHARAILEKLELPYRQVLLCTKDMGFGSSKTYDLEVWLPGQNAYREISSVTNFLDFQARRMGLRAKDGKQKFIPHTLNGSALAVGRTLVAIIENYQQEDGTVLVPDALKPWMRGIERLN